MVLILDSWYELVVGYLVDIVSGCVVVGIQIVLICVSKVFESFDFEKDVIFEGQ